MSYTIALGECGCFSALAALSGPVIMAYTYFKRFRMELDLTRQLFQPPLQLPQYRLVPWCGSLLSDHADTKYRSFRHEVDANVFPSLGEPAGCQRLMKEIVRRKGFLPEATWLMSYESPQKWEDYCGTVQGIVDWQGKGSIQNLGVTPEHRGHQLGTLLLHQSLAAFQSAGVRRATLEVTAQNAGAVRLYQRLGFRTVKTVYKAVEVAYA